MVDFIYLKDEEILSLLNWNEVIDATKTALLSVTEKRAIQNPRTITGNSSLNNKNSVLITMPGCLNDEKYGGLACKLVTSFPNNTNLNPKLPCTNAIIVLFDEENGTLKALMDGREITKLRTAAASIVATKYLKNGKDLRVLSILGCGDQGRIHAEAFLNAFNFEQIRMWNYQIEPARILVDELNQKYKTNIFSVSQSSEDCVRDADVIVTATFATEPIVELKWLKRGVHINAVGVTTKVPAEVSSEIYLNADVFIDHWDGAKSELKPLELMGVEFKGEIGEVISGKISRPPLETTTIFDSLGMAVEDCAVARLVYDKFVAKRNKQF